AVKAAEKVLASGKVLFGSGVDLALIKELGLLTAKPFLYVSNSAASYVCPLCIRLAISFESD
ncbi:MAG: hypothetical protein ACKPKO_37885, partial [Candidatus Fonsibacter sp.]